ncbi:DUF58 domain-containing protein [Verrucosispora sp. FIM060022]|uniref:DUF58 domain-containing protein n=1 Tax=Verrucosispora sp. FIM060022 TaxID=1479020 RepID=UPI000F874D90|nr:DUF58 domain-containing protein [Verrucosispora sp. FIM060022]RUL94551.1 DUF58 domain-containing protein [Verrucosispora sp. FIM060022]
MGITARGIGLLVAGVLLLGTGFRFGYPELTVLGAAAGVAVAVAVLSAAWRPRLQVRRQADPDRVARGEPAAMTLTVRNMGRLRSASLLAADRCGDQVVPVPVLRLRPGADTTVRYEVPTARRGVVPVGPLRVTRRDPLGLVVVARSYGDSVPVWVHPKIHPLRAVPTGAGRSLDGRVDSVPHGSITFDSLREYVVGDELRRVHWRTSARIGELMVRENVDTSLPRIVVLLDNRLAAHPQRVRLVAESFESACEAAASVVTAAVREDLPVTLLFVAAPDDLAGASTAADGPGDGGPTVPLDRLAAVSLSYEGTLEAAAARLRRDRLGDTLVVLTGPGGRDDLGHVGALRGAYPSVVVGVFGAAEPTPPGTGGLLVVDAADGAGFAAEWDGVRRW